jgi:hypothetical protein
MCDAVQAMIDKSGTASPVFLLTASAYARFASIQEVKTLVYLKNSADFKSQVIKELRLLRSTQRVDGSAAADFVVNDCTLHTHEFHESCPLRTS